MPRCRTTVPIRRHGLQLSLFRRSSHKRNIQTTEHCYQKLVSAFSAHRLDDQCIQQELTCREASLLCRQPSKLSNTNKTRMLSSTTMEPTDTTQQYSLAETKPPSQPRLVRYWQVQLQQNERNKESLRVSGAASVSAMSTMHHQVSASSPQFLVSAVHRGTSTFM